MEVKRAMYYYGVFGVCFRCVFVSVLSLPCFTFLLNLSGFVYIFWEKCHYDTRHILRRWDIYKSWFVPICLAELLKPPSSPSFFLPSSLSSSVSHYSPVFSSFYIFTWRFSAVFSSLSPVFLEGVRSAFSSLFSYFLFGLIPVSIQDTIYIARALIFSLFLLLVRYDRYQCIGIIFFPPSLSPPRNLYIVEVCSFYNILPFISLVCSRWREGGGRRGDGERGE